MDFTEQRRFPRVEAHAQQRILSYSSHNELVKNVVLSRNLSASGFCFRSSRAYEAGNELLVYFDDAVMEDIQVNRARVIKIGKYFLARVVWSRLVPLVSDPYHEIGCTFIELLGGDADKLDFFTRLVNHDMAHRMGQDAL